MDHSYIETHGIVDRYFQGDLEAEEEALFERHFFDCEGCQEQLAAARDFRRGLRRAAAADLETLAARRLGLLAWLVQCGRGAQAAILAATILAAAALPTAFFLSRSQGGGAGPTVAPAVVLLSGLRGEGQAPTARHGEAWVLAVDAGGSDRFATYRARVLDAAGAEVFNGAGLRPNALEVLMISFPAGSLAEGDYRLELEGVPASGAAEPVASYPFRIVP